ncbi:hypothetical protein IDH50_13360 [Aeromicrobium tamlense]|uniref:Uncharacterized protein n=1 Tax=Aeromicrobium tamlense TaxID=375541 RepID=A0A8I0FZ92_9ACTN|nr:hypothetical protein [Aeromicrobium tamlense]MBD1270642.1 hypothetical protein [Aeromicrobium tamlense]MBD1271226.1 hypothetical protein [Aeromicrobium tamlense]NYI38029.1 hypothetical protein [Aeromicrobium tamlense]
MTLVFDGTIEVHYGFGHLQERGDDPAELDMAGQRNGLCGAKTAGQLVFLIGLHTGGIRFAIDWLDSEPSLDESWEDVVEVSIDVPAGDIVLATFDDWRDVPLPASGPHRARLHASGLDEARELPSAELGPDRYLLQLWPAPITPDAVIRQTSQAAARMHASPIGTPRHN